MDNRIELSKHERLGFPGMECVIDNFVGRGTNVLVYTGHYQDHHIPDLSHCVLVRELFPYDPEDGIRRNANGSIYVEPGSQALFDLNRKTFLRGNAVHIHLMENIPADIDTNINTFDYNNTLYSLVGYTGGRSLDEEIERWKRKRIIGAGPEGLLHIVRVKKAR